MGLEQLHRLPRDHVATKPVSARSIWSDRVWLFDNPTAGASPVMVDWGRGLANGSTLLDPEWGPFLEACKCLLWSLITEPIRGRPLKVGSLDGWIYGLWFIVDWMSTADYRHMHELDAGAIDEYLEHLISEKLPEDDEDTLSGQQLSKYIRPLAHMWWQTDALAASGMKTLPEQPFGGRAFSAVAADLSEFTYGEIPSVDDATFIATVNCLDAWVGYRGEDIVRLLDLTTDLKQSHGPNCWKQQMLGGKVVVRPELADFRFSTDPATGLPWHASIDTIDGASRTVRTLVRALNMAGIIAVQAMTGLRISEVCGLDADPRHLGPYPSCIEVESSASGLYDVFFITGKLFKTTSLWIDARWVAGLRPKGSAHLPPPVRAIMLIERLFRRWRRDNALAALFITTKARHSSPQSKNKIKRQRSANPPQNVWIVEHVGLVPATRVTSHQWRKAFAKFLFRTDKRLLPSIALHLKHVSLAMTELYAGGDLELIDDIDSEASRHASEVLFEWASGVKAAKGPVAKMIMDRCAELGNRLGNHSDDEKREEIDRIVQENSIRVWTLTQGEKNYGTCVFRPGAAICRADQIGPVLRPDAAAANPGLCAGCTSLAVDDGHLPFWTERLASNERLFGDNRDTDKGVAMLARKRIDQSRHVLGWLGQGTRGGEIG